VSGKKCTSVPRLSVAPMTRIGETSTACPSGPTWVSTRRFCTTPRANSSRCTLPSRRTVSRSQRDSALTQLTPHPVQAAGDLVAVLVELAAGVQLGQRDFGRAALGLVLVVPLDAGGDAAPIVHHADRVIGVDGHDDIVAMSGQRLVDGVVHHLEHQMVQAGTVGRVADIHARALAHRLQAFEDLDRFGAVARAGSVKDLRFGHGIFHRRIGITTYLKRSSPGTVMRAEALPSCNSMRTRSWLMCASASVR
jgi:hypothetical protein